MLPGFDAFTARGLTTRRTWNIFARSAAIVDGILDVVYDYEAVKSELHASALGREPRFFDVALSAAAAGERSNVDSRISRLAGRRSTKFRDWQANWAWRAAGSRTRAAIRPRSFKDRASAVGVVKALEKKASRRSPALPLAMPLRPWPDSAAAAGIAATIFVPARAPQAKVAQLLVYGAQVFSVEGTYDEAWELCMKASAEFGWYNRNCAINPYLIEGKKTVSLELAEQFMRIAPGSFPDWVVVSVGDGCTIGGVWKGLREMHILGFIPRLPRILGVQADGCKPFLTAWRDKSSLVPCAANTLADSIAVGHPRNFSKGMSAVTESGGAFVSVSDEEILQSIPMLAQKAGVFGEPAGVAGVAGVSRAVELGVIDRSESVAIVITGNGLERYSERNSRGGKHDSGSARHGRSAPGVRCCRSGLMRRVCATGFSRRKKAREAQDGKNSLWSHLR